MFNKTLSMFLLFAIFIATFSHSGAAQAAASDRSTGDVPGITVDDKTLSADEAKTNTETKPSKFAVLKADSKSEKSAAFIVDHRLPKAPDKKFSTSTKILIGVGIAAALAGVFYFAASRDKIRPFK